jgi:hypothetical protein
MLPLTLPPSLVTITQISHMGASNGFQIVLYAFCFVMSGVNLISSANKSRRRMRIRALALTGDMSALPLVGVRLLGAEPADVTREPVELLWRFPRASSLMVAVLLFLVVGLTVGVTWAIVEAAPNSFWPVVLIGVAVALMEIAFTVWLRLRSRGSTGVVATYAGLRWVRAGQERAFMPWDEARLLEIWRMNRTEGFAVSSGRTLIEWQDYLLAQMPPAADGSSSEAMYLRSQTLLRTVISRTGLEPRACANNQEFVTSRRASATLAEIPRERLMHWYAWLLGSLFFSMLTAVPLAAAVGAPLTPLTDSLVLNLYVTVTMGALGLFILGIFIYTIMSAIRRPRVRPTVRPEIRLPDAPSITTALTLRETGIWRQRVGALAALLLVAGEFYALVRGVIYGIATASAAPIAPWDLRIVTYLALTLTTLGVGLIALIPLFERQARRFTDEQGIHFVRGKKTTLIPWNMVADLVITVWHGKVWYFTAVAGDSQRTEITWWPGETLDGVTLPSGESPGAIFAASVAQRAGVTPRVEYE